MVGLVIENVAAAHNLVALHQGLDATVEVALLDNGHSGEDAGHYDDGHYYTYRAVGPLDLGLIGISYNAWEAQVLDHNESGKGYEDAVDGEKVERSADEVPVESGYSEAHGAERRHQGGSNGHAGKHRTLFLAGVLQHSRHSAEGGYKHIVDGRVGSGKQLGLLGELQRRDDEIQGGGKNGDADHHREILQGFLDEGGVIGTQAQTEAQNRAHQRGYEHRTDNHRD